MANAKSLLAQIGLVQMKILWPVNCDDFRKCERRWHYLHGRMIVLPMAVGCMQKKDLPLLRLRCLRLPARNMFAVKRSLANCRKSVYPLW